MRSPRMPLAAGSQCESAPSSSVKRISVLPAGSLSYSSRDCPGQNCSWSGSVTSTGQVICPITSSVSAYARAAVKNSYGEVVPYGRIRNAIIDRVAGENLSASSMSLSNFSCSPASISFTRK